MKREYPSLLKILWIDYYCFISVVIPVLFWASTLVIAQLGVYPTRGKSIPLSEAWPYMILVNMLATAVCGITLILRLGRVYSIYRHSLEIPGRVDAIIQKRGVKELRFVYRYSGKDLTATATLANNGNLEAYQIGTEIGVLVNPEKPQQALINHLFD